MEASLKLSSTPIFATFDLSQLGVLPRGWDAEVARVASERCVRSVLDGGSVTSRETDPTVRIEVDVVSGDVIAKELKWLDDLYRRTLCRLVSDVVGAEMFPSKEQISAVNINRIFGIGGRYEWHVDSNPLTGILFVTTLSPEDGGELCFRGRGVDRIVRPSSGTFLAFDARTIPHAVMPLKRDIVRLSIPMNYYDSEFEQVRPTDLDGYLYAEGTK